MIKSTGIDGLFLIQPKVFTDHRGYFFESYNSIWWEENDRLDWVQDNEALSNKGVLRGLHYQIGEHAQAKLVRVVKGEVLDVVVDVRPSSRTYGKVFSEILNDTNKTQLLIPRGFAHGYVVLEDDTIFSYKCDNSYNKESEGGIDPMDPSLNIDWLIPKKHLILSEKDKALPAFGKHEIAL